MKAISTVCAIGLLFVFWSSCTTAPTPKRTAEYTAGQEAGEAQAEEDVLRVQCGGPWEPTYLEITQKARSYTHSLRDRGRSQEFIQGFYSGYRDTFYDRLESLCDI